jgi:hypothetical protein
MTHRYSNFNLNKKIDFIIKYFQKIFITMAFDHMGIFWNAKFFLALNPEADNYYEATIEILQLIEQASESVIIIYGGYIRRIIENCLENVHKDLDDRHFKLPPNINIWLQLPAPINCETWIEMKFKILNMLASIYDVFSVEDPSNLTDNPSFKITCNHINFEIKTQILGKHNYTIHHNCDFTVNNLMMDMKGKIVPRVSCQYDYNTIFQHIYDRKLFSIYIYKYNLQHPISIKAQTIMEHRKQKMVEYGYD